ncbi:hypothetical protein BS47DRAFT_1361378 [Hydnum rufescens UP504]|uniref:Uncharacterized protein n=1 Tax=Hydnum rufescens UP504 TaxID=1448309 RepID=A0A9P6DYJ1_9AGAM|nr:hypothetical protein BS47DRAFT_1361378 [Hydnum rufescens UP504]
MPLDSLIITIFVLHHTLIIDLTLHGGRSTAIFLLGTFLKYLDVAVGKIAPLDPMANKSVLASSKANLKTYQGCLVRQNSTNGASDEEAPKTKVLKLPTCATKRKVIDSSSEEPTSSDADRALKTRTHKEVKPPPRHTIKHFAVMGASQNETYEALNVIENAPKKPKLLRCPATECLAILKSSNGHTSSNDKELPKSGKSGPPGGKQVKSNYHIIGPKSSAIHSLHPYVRIPPRQIEPPKALSPQHHLSSPHYLSPPNIAGPELINLEIRPHSPVSDTPSTLLEEAQRISDPHKILDDAQELVHHLHPSIHVAHPGDFLNVWDADALDNILLALPDEGADPLDDYEYVDHTLNHVFQVVSISRLVEEMRRGPCGALGIIKGLAFFADKQGLNLDQFEIKILKLLKVLCRCLLVPSGPSPMHTLDLAWPAAPTALVPKVPRVGMISASQMQCHGEMSINGPQSDSDNGGSSDIDDDVDCIGRQVQSSTSPTPTFGKSQHGYTLGDHPIHSMVSQAELTDVYIKEKESFNGDSQALKNWLDELHTVAQSSRVENDVKLMSGTKVAKFMSWQKKCFKGEMGHMSKFDIHTIMIMVCGCPNAHAAHAQNAIICSSPEIESLIEGSFNLQKSLDELFVKVLHQRLDRSSLAKWHQEAEKKEHDNELKQHDSAYSMASKYIKNLFTSNSYTWFPSIVPWVRFLSLLVQYRICIIGWPLETECPAPHPRHTNKQWDASQWRFLVTQFHKGHYCPIKVEAWGSGVDSMGESRAATEQPGVLPVPHGRSKHHNVSSKPSRGKGRACAILVPTNDESSDSEANAEAMPILHPGNFNSNPVSTSGCATSLSYPDFRTAPNTNIGAGRFSSSAIVHLNTGSTSWHAAPLHSNFATGSNGNIHASSSLAFNPHDFFVSDSDITAMGSHLDNGTLQSNIGMFPSGINNFDTLAMGLGDMYDPNGFQSGSAWDSYLQ